MPNIPQMIGNTAKFGGEFLLNLADPNRKRLQQAAQLQRQKYLYDMQNEMLRANNALNRGIEEAEIQAGATKLGHLSGYMKWAVLRRMFLACRDWGRDAATMQPSSPSRHHSNRHRHMRL
jgi:hypothetical protein